MSCPEGDLLAVLELGAEELGGDSLSPTISTSTKLLDTDAACAARDSSALNERMSTT